VVEVVAVVVVVVVEVVVEEVEVVVEVVVVVVVEVEEQHRLEMGLDRFSYNDECKLVVVVGLVELGLLEVLGVLQNQGHLEYPELLLVPLDLLDLDFLGHLLVPLDQVNLVVLGQLVGEGVEVVVVGVVVVVVEQEVDRSPSFLPFLPFLHRRRLRKE